jgi:hypothetical protein
VQAQTDFGYLSLVYNKLVQGGFSMKDLISKLVPRPLGSTTAAAMVLLAASVGATAGSLNQGLNLKDFGTFYVNGQTITTAHPSANPAATPGRVVINQMFVEYFIPNESNGNPKVPVVMVHGSNHTGVTWMTTPDGREGWATYFIRHGYRFTWSMWSDVRARAGIPPTQTCRRLTTTHP